MKASFRIAVLGAVLALAACNSTNAPKPEAAVANTDYKKLGGIHAHHTPEQHAAFLKRVGQLPSDDETDVSGGGGGGGHHH
jgi:cobalamin biosynthesis protein CobD/CbiB